MTEHDLTGRVERLRQQYASIGGPAAAQWDHLLSVPAGRPVSLVNLFAFREVAEYADPDVAPTTGRDAFDAYAAVSGPALDRVGGRFVHFGTHRGNLVGEEESWDLLVVGEYPDVAAVLALHEDPAYQAAYVHRVAACERQRVLVSA